MNHIYDNNNRIPVDKNAAIVTSKGVSYIPDCKIHVEEFISPPEMLSNRRFPRNPNFIDLTGRKKGRFTVIGLLLGSKLNQWVVRCACGTYTTRTTKSIKSAETNPLANFDACRECMHLAFIKREEHWRRTGRDIDISSVW